MRAFVRMLLVPFLASIAVFLFVGPVLEFMLADVDDVLGLRPSTLFSLAMLAGFMTFFGLPLLTVLAYGWSGYSRDPESEAGIGRLGHLEARTGFFTELRRPLSVTLVVIIVLLAAVRIVLVIL